MKHLVHHLCFFYAILLLTLLLFEKSVYSQETYILNGRAIIEYKGKYFSLNNSTDTTFITSNYLTIEFNEGVSHHENINLIENENLKLVGIVANKFYVYELPAHTNFKVTVERINNNINVKKTFLDFVGKFSSANSKPMPNDPIINTPSGYVQNPTFFVGCPEDECFDEYQFLNLRDAWGITTGRYRDYPVPIVAILDNGVDWQDPDLPDDNYLGINYTVTPPNNNTSIANYMGSYLTHGSQITSIICSKTNNNDKVFGVAGGWTDGANIKEGIKPMMIKISYRDMPSYPSSSLLPLGIQYAAENGANVVNINACWEADMISNSEQQVIIAAIDNALSLRDNISIVAASGNYAQGQGGSSLYRVMFPANYPPVISVGGANESHFRYTNSNYSSCYGESLDFVTSMCVPVNNTRYSNINQRIGIGTSYSAALLSGVIALMYSVNPCLTNAEVLYYLKNSCYKNPGLSFDSNGHNNELGYGFPNAYKAIKSAIGEGDFIVNGNINITGTRQFNGNIIVERNGVLNINNSYLKFGPESSIIVNSGGTVIINNSVLTNLCILPWLGIKAYGVNEQQTNYPLNYSTISLNNSQIINSITGIDSYFNSQVKCTRTLFTNNTTHVKFRPFSFNKNSFFNNCTFTNNNAHLQKSEVISMLTCSNVKDVSFYSCEFNNNFKDSQNKIQYGNCKAIQSHQSYLKISYNCNLSGTYPPGFICPIENRQPCVFRNFYIAIQNTSNTGFYVDNAIFTNNLTGIYCNSNNGARIWNNKFEIPTDYDPDPRGIHLVNSTGYHIEANKFTKSGSQPHADELGMYIENSGTSYNEIYNNEFNDLFRGIVAFANNRNSINNVGLCIKCNDFSNNAVDISVLPANTNNITPLDGIAKMQGFSSNGSTSSQKDTLAAGNLFTKNPYQCNIFNNTNEINYFYHGNYNAFIHIIKPNINCTIKPINLNANLGTTYNKSISCATKIIYDNSASSINLNDTVVEMKRNAILNYKKAKLLYDNSIDGGNTSKLLYDVINCYPTEAKEVEKMLIYYSPLLSDTVIKSFILKEDIYNNDILVNVLLKNPQVFKNPDLIKIINQRLPQTFNIRKINNDTLLNYSEILKLNYEKWLYFIDYLNNNITSNIIYSFSTNVKYDSLVSFFESDSNYYSKLNLIKLYIDNKKYTFAKQVISDVLLTKISLHSMKNQIIELGNYINILEEYENNKIDILTLDSIKATPLFNFIDLSTDYYAKELAKSLLMANGLIEADLHVNLADCILYDEESKDFNNNNMWAYVDKITNNNFRISPNPANDFLIVDYNISDVQSSSISISNILGKTFYNSKLKNKNGQLLIDISNLKEGIYYLHINSNSYKKTEKIIVN